MSESLFSTFWYRVANLRPRLRSHAELHRQRFRGQTWYLVQDHHTGRFHRLAPAAHYIVCLMDGRRSMRTIWELAEARYGAELPSQDDVMRLLSQLHSADLLVAQGLPDTLELDKRARRIQRQNLLTRIRNPLAMRFPLWDPDSFLTATLPLVRPLFSWAGALAWLTLVISGAIIASIHWQALTSDLSDRVFSADNILLFVLVYPLVKAVHELGHAYAAKTWGGEVHEIGLMFLVLMPVPYVDASSSIAFPQWWRRAVVGAAGILVELALASGAVIGWVYSEPGLVRAALFNVALIGGVSTLLFNGNPLLRFDGYYVLCDLLRIPNLATRANRYLGYLVQRYAFAREAAESPVAAASERGWFVLYAVMSYSYRIAITIGIALFVGTSFFFLGVLLALWAVFGMMIWPLLKNLKFVVTGAELREHRQRAMAVTGGAGALLLLTLFVLPLPNATVAQGVVWASAGSAIRAQTPGLVTEVLKRPGSIIARGDALLQLADPELQARTKITESRIQELTRRYDALFSSNRVEASILKEEIARARDHLENFRQRIDALTVRAPSDGYLVLPDSGDLVGRFVSRGQELGLSIAESRLRIRVVVPEARITLVRAGSPQVSIRLASALDDVLPGNVIQEVPAAGNILPSAALAGSAGGPFPVDPTSTGEPRSLTPIFQFDVAVDLDVHATAPGERAYIRFDHGTAPLASILYREIRQLFLSQFDV